MEKECTLKVSTTSDYNKWQNTLDLTFKNEQKGNNFNFQCGTNSFLQGGKQVNCYTEINSYFTYRGAYKFQEGQSLGSENTFNVSQFTGKYFNFYGYDIIFVIINIIIKTRKRRLYNHELMSNNIKNSYNSICIGDLNSNQENNEQDNNVSLEDIDINVNDNAIYERNSKMTSIIGENYLNISFLVVKSFMGILFIIYFTRIGEKLDDKTSSTTWVILFIPCYILFLPVILFCIFHCLSLYSNFKNKIWIPIITIFPCIFTFVANSVIIPLKLDNKITFHEAFITVFFAMGTVFLLIHLYVINKYKKS